MPRLPKDTTTTKNTTTTAAAPAAAVAVAPVEVATPAPAPAPATDAAPTKQRRSKQEKSESKSAAAPAPATEPVAPVVTGNDATDVEPRVPRVAPTRESLMAEFSELLSLVDAEITRLRDQGDKSSQTRFLRTTVQRRMKVLQAATARVLRHKTPSARRNNNSGFLKPVNISSDIAKFTGLDPKSQHSRVDVTKFLCKYIEEKKLQNPADRRQINADPALAKLLNYDSKNGKALTYYHMQSLLKNHFSKPAVAPAPTASQ